MNRVRATLVALLMAVLVAPVAADPLQDRLDRIAEEMPELASRGAKVLHTRSVVLAMRYKG